MRYLLLLLLLAGCAPNSGGGAGSASASDARLIANPTTNSKLLQSVWTVPDQSFTMDLSQIVASESFESNPVIIDFANSKMGKCQCYAGFVGDESSGYFNMGSCSYIQGSGSKPNCDFNVDSNAFYTKDGVLVSNSFYQMNTDNTLTICFSLNHTNCPAYN